MTQIIIDYESHLWDEFFYPVQCWGPVNGAIAGKPRTWNPGSCPVKPIVLFLYSTFIPLFFANYTVAAAILKHSETATADNVKNIKNVSVDPVKCDAVDDALNLLPAKAHIADMSLRGKFICRGPNVYSPTYCPGKLLSLSTMLKMISSY